MSNAHKLTLAFIIAIGIACLGFVAYEIVMGIAPTTLQGVAIGNLAIIIVWLSENA